MSTGRILPAHGLSSFAYRRLAAQVHDWVAAFPGAVCLTRRPLKDLERGRYPHSLPTLYRRRKPWRLLPNTACILFETAPGTGVSALADALRRHIDPSLVDEITVGAYAIYADVRGVVEPKVSPHSGQRSPTAPLRS